MNDIYHGEDYIYDIIEEVKTLYGSSEAYVPFLPFHLLGTRAYWMSNALGIFNSNSWRELMKKEVDM